MAKTTRIQNIYCPWCHAPVVFVEKLPMATADPEVSVSTDRYDCAGPVRHTILVMPGLE
jgi:hypothetical protein